TRLQVEHPVTEMVTGVDIVKEQLAIAAGRKLRYRQEDINLRGHAIECRINAEDPYAGFLPQAGRITGLTEPTGPGVRLESGIYDGFEVTPFYDPLLAKLIAWGETRAEAILRMRRALEELRISGLHTTIPFHQQMMDSMRFQSGQFDTGFVEEPGGFRLQGQKSRNLARVAALAAVLVEHERTLEALTMGAPCERQGQGLSAWRQAAGAPRWR
ncbi:MAG TPA: acetyl-CoA carboxylase biotin carboxylase subunit, partial [Anaerolineae bacterium]